MSDNRTHHYCPLESIHNARFRDRLALSTRIIVDWTVIQVLVSKLLKADRTPEDIHDWFLNSTVTYGGMSNVLTALVARFSALQKLDKARRRAAARRTSWIARARAWIKE